MMEPHTPIRSNIASVNLLRLLELNTSIKDGMFIVIPVAQEGQQNLPMIMGIKILSIYHYILTTDEWIYEEHT
jgi:hypothetical protein